MPDTPETQYSSAANTPAKADEVFSKRMEDLRTAVAQEATRLVGDDSLGGVTKWLELYSNKPGSSNSDEGTAPGKVLDGFNSEEFIAAFSRTALNDAYVKTTQKNTSEPLSYRDAQALKVQIDLLAGMERELRMRYRSRVRQLAHGAARLTSHGLVIGPIAKGAPNFVKILLDRK